MPLQPRLYIIDLPQELLQPLQVLQLVHPRLAPVLRYDHPLLGWPLHDLLDLVRLVVIVLNEIGAAVLNLLDANSLLLHSLDESLVFTDQSFYRIERITVIVVVEESFLLLKPTHGSSVLLLNHHHK